MTPAVVVYLASSHLPDRISGAGWGELHRAGSVHAITAEQGPTGSADERLRVAVAAAGIALVDHPDLGAAIETLSLAPEEAPGEGAGAAPDAPSSSATRVLLAPCPPGWSLGRSAGRSDRGSAAAAMDSTGGDRGQQLLTALQQAGVDARLHVEPPLPGAALLSAVEVQQRLRDPGGCPWDAEQDHATLRRYLLEETYEAYDALASGNSQDLREELGDVLLQVLFHASIAAGDPAENWTVDDVAADLVTKLVRRHPHVFDDIPLQGPGTPAEQVFENWEVLKRAEKQRDSAMDGVALSQPALSLAQKYLTRTARSGLSPRWLAGLRPMLPRAIASELTEAMKNSDTLGQLLLAIVANASDAGVDAEAALRDKAVDYARWVRRGESESTSDPHRPPATGPRGISEAPPRC